MPRRKGSLFGIAEHSMTLRATGNAHLVVWVMQLGKIRVQHRLLHCDPLAGVERQQLLQKGDG